MRMFIDMDGTLAKWNNVEFEQLFEKGYYRNLEPNWDLVDIVNKLISEGEKIYVLSAYLPDSAYALEEKQEWLRQYLPDLSEYHQIFVPYDTNKAEYLAKNTPITKQDYLIDDYTKNLQEWQMYGGTGVKYLNGINHTKGTWRGFVINEKSPLCNRTDLFTFVVGEKLKDYGVSMISVYDGGGPGDLTYEVVYKSKLHNLNGLFWDKGESTASLTTDDIVKTICNELYEQQSLAAMKAPVDAAQLEAAGFTQTM